ncbi:MAG: aldo/keto reductase [Phycisphaerales bacterium]|nr:aldo/keto reductase [Phycisphaerales bacterium]
MERRPLGRTGLEVTPLGFGAFKIGRNEGIKYPEPYLIPSDDEVARLLDGILDLGINLIDTAPAYGTSEERIGQCLASRRDEYLLSSKAGEQWKDGHSCYDFSPEAIRRSVQESLSRLQTDHLDLLLLHSDGSDLQLQQDGVLPNLLRSLRDAGMARAIGMSGKSSDGMHAALEWADVVMLEYNIDDTTMEPVIRAAADQGVGVLVKKGLGSGHLMRKPPLHS